MNLSDIFEFGCLMYVVVDESLEGMLVGHVHIHDRLQIKRLTLGLESYSFGRMDNGENCFFH